MVELCNILHQTGIFSEIILGSSLASFSPNASLQFIKQVLPLTKITPGKTPWHAISDVGCLPILQHVCAGRRIGAADVAVFEADSGGALVAGDTWVTRVKLGKTHSPDVCIIALISIWFGDML